ncbi:adenosine deaminase [Streptomyces sp. NBC_01619]|uniref:adenosine deaminase family protein n=1 Tax=Streptomyces sp. NBC_01619 TaxID=2975901 RepID=UPI0022527035|nr:adenosine deaminase [Streptomyces sp. NBC_01619]MCX4514153.1 adenosine deaminase [Streptomyces sp. NBC_01619]
MNSHRPRAACRRAAPLHAGLGCLAVLSLLPALPAAARPAHAPAPRPETPAERRVSSYLDSVRDRPEALRAFFRALPKGGDLHHHLSGAAPTEFLIRLAGEDGLCVDASMTAVPPPCGPGARPASDAAVDAAFHRAILRAWSMQDFPPGQPGHDHFFATFGKFGAVTEPNRGKLLAEVAAGAVAQNQLYLESMVTPAVAGAERLADEVGYDEDLGALHRKLLAGSRMDRLVAEARQEADAADAQFRTAAHCGTARPDPGCSLPVRWISHVYRASSPERVFTQIVLGMRLAERDRRFVAVNLVQPEDWEVPLRDYRLHMRMLDHLHRAYPRARLTLHAGELAPGLVKPEDLTFHIREAVRTGHAERIGHGVDLRHEDDWQELARLMARRRIAVEVPLTSNAQILGVSGDAHPFRTYRRYGVPVVLSTDDPGVSRTDLGTEYQRAATSYGLGYRELKDLARDSLEYAFLPGPGLWRADGDGGRHRPAGPCRRERPGSQTPRPACARLLAGSPKAALQWRLEAAFARFERRF